MGWRSRDYIRNVEGRNKAQRGGISGLNKRELTIGQRRCYGGVGGRQDLYCSQNVTLMVRLGVGELKRPLATWA